MRQFSFFIKKQVGFFLGFEVPLYAANASFYIVLSLFPAVMLIVGLLPYIGISREHLLAALSSVIPSVLEPLVSRVVEDMSENSSRALISLTAIVAVWSSSRGVYCIQIGLNSIYKVRESRNYFYRRAISMLYTILLIAALLLTLVLQGFGRELAAFFRTKSIPIMKLLVRILDFRELIIFLLLTALFAGVFCVLPNQKQRFRSALPGAALASLGWLIFTFGFSIYARLSGSFSLLYGSLAIIAMGMLWLYVCICILFYGCVFNLWLIRKK